MLPKVLIGSGWDTLLEPIFKNPKWEITRNFLLENKDIVTPLIQNIFKPFLHCKKENLKVVIVGLAPYPELKDNKRVATGIPFGNDYNGIIEVNGFDPSPSLDIIVQTIGWTEISLGCHKDMPFDWSLITIAEQGVLWINVYWTCKINNTDSLIHGSYWSWFTSALLQKLSIEFDNLAFVLMGYSAQNFKDDILGKNHFINECCHPEETVKAAKKENIAVVKKDVNFIKQNPFMQVNEYLQKVDKKQIKWY